MKFKTTHTEAIQAAPKNQYPYVGISYPNGCIVMFTKKNTGVCLQGGSGIVETIGEFSTCWYESEFVPFYGKVTITSTK